MSKRFRIGTIVKHIHDDRCVGKIVGYHPNEKSYVITWTWHEWEKDQTFNHTFDTIVSVVNYEDLDRILY